VRSSYTSSSRLVCGLDEAGRGSIVGPLVVGGVALEESSIGELSRLGVRDSKLLSAEKREAIYEEVVHLCRGVAVLEISPREIDRYVARGRPLRQLNYLEARYMAKAVDRLSPAIDYADACDVLPKRFSEDISRNLTVKTRVIAEHHADSNYPVVSAASIVAKVERDRAVSKLRDRFGDFGSGYPSDLRTIAFLKEWVTREGLRPEFCRSSWKTWAGIAQTQLSGTSQE